MGLHYHTRQSVIGSNRLFDDGRKIQATLRFDPAGR